MASFDEGPGFRCHVTLSNTLSQPMIEGVEVVVSYQLLPVVFECPYNRVLPKVAG